MVSKYRPQSPVIAITSDEKILPLLALLWGVIPVKSTKTGTTDELLHAAMADAEQTGLLAEGDFVVITAGAPVGLSGTTNLIKIEQYGV
ncbi:Pyruvate kinase, alpha/beta domain [Paenibacillus algorifonticola]|uniref:Pyruvate kinase, alpha/beta domain n=2 Tax=Paenibacillus algorifonticola TaxID=684063 RepID=A0A1I2HFP5_9BACL|nr:Pyruvate kinase, alpha/beta domain [Paenibacillus algorifonticola]